MLQISVLHQHQWPFIFDW